MMRRAAIVMAVAGAAMLTAACVVPIPLPQRCDATNAQGWLGQPYSERLAGRVTDLSHALRYRAGGPDTVMTMEFDARRVTITYDEANRVTAIRCG